MIRHIAVVLVLLAGCYRLEDSEPFPCANDQTCPTSFSCVPEVGCLSAERECKGEAGRDWDFVCDGVGKCTWVGIADGSTKELCVARGTQTRGQNCVRFGLGIDDCDVGLECVQSADGNTTCQPLCVPGSGDTTAEVLQGCANYGVCTTSTEIGYDANLRLCAAWCPADSLKCPLGYSCRDVHNFGEPGWVMTACTRDGPRKLDQSCSMEGAERCAYDLMCIGTATGEHVCKKQCATSSSCGTGYQCLKRLTDTDGRSPTGSAAPTTSLCSCDPFTIGACASGTDCKLTSIGGYGDVGSCEKTGTVAVGQACSANQDCAKGLSCQPGLKVCVAHCNSSHPCPSGKQCSGQAGGWGECT